MDKLSAFRWLGPGVLLLTSGENILARIPPTGRRSLVRDAQHLQRLGQKRIAELVALGQAELVLPDHEDAVLEFLLGEEARLRAETRTGITREQEEAAGIFRMGANQLEIR